MMGLSVKFGKSKLMQSRFDKTMSAMDMKKLALLDKKVKSCHEEHHKFMAVDEKHECSHSHDESHDDSSIDGMMLKNG